MALTRTVLSSVYDSAIPAIIELLQFEEGRYDLFVHSANPICGGDRGDDSEEGYCDRLGGHCYYTAPNSWTIIDPIVSLWKSDKFDEVQCRLAEVLTEFCLPSERM